MKASIIKIGNSRGIRIPKKVLEETGLTGEVNVTVNGNKVVLSPASRPAKKTDDWAALGNSAFAKEWDTPEEDEAWAYLQ
jgi:antitoxin MazE